jgi:hypothetical protein
MDLQCGLAGIELDQQEQFRVVSILVDIEAMASRLLFQGGSRMQKQTRQEPVNDVGTDPQMRCVQQGQRSTPLQVLLFGSRLVYWYPITARRRALSSRSASAL